MKDTLHIYTRVSTKSQEDEGTSLETQRADAIRYAKNKGMEYKVYNEGAMSSARHYTDRPKLVEIINGIEDGDIKHIYAYDFSRVSRERVSQAVITKILQDNGASFHSQQGVVDLCNDDQDLLLTIQAAFARHDNTSRARRTKRGKVAAVKQGNWHGGPTPFGYKLSNSKLVVEDEESKWVVHIYERYADGASADIISRELSKEGVRTRRNKSIWSSGSVTKILENTHYNGFYYFTDSLNKEEIRIECPVIIDNFLYKKVENCRNKRSKSKNPNRNITRNRKKDFLLQDILTCGECNSKFTTTSNKYSEQYRCRQYNKKYRNTDPDWKECTQKRSLNVVETDSIVWNTILSIIENSEKYRRVIDEDYEIEGRRIRKKLADAKKKISRKKNKLEKDINDIGYYEGRLHRDAKDEDAKKAKSELSKTIDSLKIEISELEKEEDALEKELRYSQEEDAYRQFYEEKTSVNYTDKEKNEFLLTIIESIKVTESDTIFHNLEIILKDDFYTHYDSETDSVFDTKLLKLEDRVLNKVNAKSLVKEYDRLNSVIDSEVEEQMKKVIATNQLKTINRLKKNRSK